MSRAVGAELVGVMSRAVGPELVGVMSRAVGPELPLAFVFRRIAQEVILDLHATASPPDVRRGSAPPSTPAMECGLRLPYGLCP